MRSGRLRRTLLAAGLVIASAVGVVLPASMASASGGQVSGRVEDERRRGIEDIGVEICPVPAPPGNIGCFTVVSDEFGNWLLPTVAGAQGDYSIRYFDGTQTFLTEWHDDAPDLASATPITIGPDQHADVRATLRASGSISGRVTDVNDLPADDVPVYVQPVGDGLIQQSRTGPDGTYVVDGLLPGDHVVRFGSVSSGPYGQVWFDDAGDQASSTPVSVSAATDTGSIDAEIPTRAIISGTVTDASGQPLEGIRVSPQFGPRGFAGFSGADGSYAVFAEPGSYRISFSSDDGRYAQEYWDSATIQGATVLDLAAADAVTGVDASMERAGWISGTVTDAAGAPIDDVLVFVRAVLGSGRGIRTAADGTYRFTGLPADSYSVEFDHPDFVFEYWDDAVDFDDVTRVEVGPTDASGIDAQLARAGAIVGTVRDAAGGVLGGARVTVCRGEVCRSEITASDGSYTVASLLPADYSVRFEHAEHLTEWFDGAPDADGADLVTVPDATIVERIDARLAKPGSISGTVAAGGSPAELTTVFACPSRGTCASQVVEADGTYAIDGLFPGDYTVEFDTAVPEFADEFWPNSLTAADADPIAVASSGAVTGIDAELSMAGSISGAATAADGRPLFASELSVEACSASLGVCESARPGFGGSPVGEYVVGGLPPADDYIVFFESIWEPQPAQSEWWCDAETIGGAVPVSVVAGEQLTGVDVSFRLVGAADHDTCDVDADSVPDPIDNCVDDVNTDQSDGDDDGLGDVCDPADERTVITSLAPSRFADSRDQPTFDGRFRNTGRRAAGTTWEIEVAGRGGVPADAEAVAVNVTLLRADARVFATVFPCGEVPEASSANADVGVVAPNEVIATLSDAGTLCIFTSGDVHVIVDVVGHVTDAAYGALAPSRFADSRDEATFDGRFRDTGRRGGGTTWEIDVAGRGGVPADASAVVANVTLLGSSTRVFATVFPCGDRPDASSVNAEPGQVVPNEVIATLSEAGTICVFTSADAHAIVDIVGFLPGDAVGYRALRPERLADSRDQATVDGRFRDTGRRPGGTTWEIEVAGRGGVPDDAVAAALNVTVTGATGSGFATVFACGDVPGTSSSNHQTAVARANEVVTALSDGGTICIFTTTDVHVIVDVAGAIVPS